MRHRIIIGGAVRRERACIRLIRKSIAAALKAENVRVRCEINVLLTDSEGIREINRNMRGVDKATDVLSFPMFEFTPGAFDPEDGQTDPLSRFMPLGDMALNMDRVRSQGEEYGHGEKRETAYLTVHSMLHLLGYDHEDEGENKKLMRSREEEIMKIMGI
ncbi:MAG: rRNA maturation RNase YbeY [Oscillospiraceae bacterium]|jgi:probable rRNA maturation factor|nr:rRNA maturation RNase YbeY [Oscillospiraceae bacterium]